MTNTNKIPWIAYFRDKSGNRVNLEIPTLQTRKLELHTSTSSLFTTVDWVFEASPELLDDIVRNNLSIGTTVYFEFSPLSLKTGNTVSSSVSVITKAFGVLSIQNISGVSAYTLGNLYNIVLCSPWYFLQNIESKAYRGRGSDIIRQVLTEEFPDNTFSEIRIKDSYDSTSTRFRTMQKQSTFINERVKEYLRGKLDSSIHTFINSDNAFEVLSYQDMLDLPHYNAIDLSHPDIGKFSQDLLDYNKSKMLIHPISITLDINNTQNRELWDISSPGLVYWLRGELKKKNMMENYGLKPALSSPTFRKIGNDGIKKFSYISGTKNINLLTKVYVNDSLDTEEDLYATSINKYYKDLQEAHTLSLTCLPNIHVLVGRLCKLHLKRQSGGESVFSQDYIIKKATTTISGDFIATTNIVLQVSSFLYKDISQAGNLLKVAPR